MWIRDGKNLTSWIRDTEYRTYQTKWPYLDDRVKDLSEVLVGICVTGIDSAVLLTATPI